MFRNIEGSKNIWTRKLNIHGDKRGRFVEIFREDLMPSPIHFIQDSYSLSIKNTARGLHSQKKQWQLITILSGSVIDLLIDANNLDLNNKFEIKLDFEETNQILLAPNIFHGFIVMSNNAILNYKSTEVYKANDERNLYIQDEFPQIYLQHQEYLILSDRDKKPKN